MENSEMETMEVVIPRIVEIVLRLKASRGTQDTTVPPDGRPSIRMAGGM